MDLGVGDPGRGPIDLASGTVTVRLPEPEDEAAAGHRVEVDDGSQGRGAASSPSDD